MDGRKRRSRLVVRKSLKCRKIVFVTDPDPDLVVVLETNDRIRLAFAKGLLEDAGIPFFVLGQIATLVQDIDPFLLKWVRIQVPHDRETEAKELLAQLEAGPSAVEPGESE
jgi:hypothetical protein